MEKIMLMCLGLLILVGTIKLGAVVFKWMSDFNRDNNW